MFRHWKLGTVKETVKTTTLDKFWTQNNLNQVRLIKIDCEGAEYLVIEGAKDVLQGKLIEFIAMEYHPTICGVDKCSITHNNIINSGYILTKVNEQCIYHLPGLETEIKPLGELKINCNWDE